MNKEHEANLSQSAFDFKEIVWPHVAKAPLVGGGEIKAVEAVSVEDFKNDLDLLAGIDAWQVIRSTSMVRGVASRVQWGKNRKTFTIRYSVASGMPTEFQKRLQAINGKSEGRLFPHLTVQAYLSEKGGRLCSAAVVKTEELIKTADFLVSNGSIGKGRHRQLYGIINGKNSNFIYLSWDYLVYKGVLTYENIVELPEIHTSTPLSGSRYGIKRENDEIEQALQALSDFDLDKKVSLFYDSKVSCCSVGFDLSTTAIERDFIFFILDDFLSCYERDGEVIFGKNFTEPELDEFEEIDEEDSSPVCISCHGTKLDSEGDVCTCCF